MNTLEDRLTALLDDLLARTRSIDAADCIESGRTDLVDAPIGRRRRVLVGVLAIVVVLAATGGVYAFTRRDATGVRIETTVPSSAASTTSPRRGPDAPATSVPTLVTVPPGSQVTEAEVRHAFNRSLQCMVAHGLVVSSSKLSIEGSDVRVSLSYDLFASRPSGDVSEIDRRCRAELIALSSAYSASHEAVDRRRANR